MASRVVIGVCVCLAVLAAASDERLAALEALVHQQAARITDLEQRLHARQLGKVPLEEGAETAGRRLGGAGGRVSRISKPYSRIALSGILLRRLKSISAPRLARPPAVVGSVGGGATGSVIAPCANGFEFCDAVFTVEMLLRRLRRMPLSAMREYGLFMP